MRLRLTAKVSRREGVAVSDRAAHIRALQRRPFAPGVHGPTSRTRLTDYGKQLREKQKAKRMYGLSERQFSNLYEEAVKMKGNSSDHMVQMLESRLDNVVYRAGFAKTRAAARQAVNHSHFSVNGKKVDIPSYRVRMGDIITIRETKRAKPLWKGIEETLSKKEQLAWLSVEAKDLTVKVTGIPAGKELLQAFDPKMIVEFYSRQ